jgi:hypothetical protein
MDIEEPPEQLRETERFEVQMPATTSMVPKRGGSLTTGFAVRCMVGVR